VAPEVSTLDALISNWMLPIGNAKIAAKQSEEEELESQAAVIICPVTALHHASAVRRMVHRPLSELIRVLAAAAVVTTKVKWKISLRVKLRVHPVALNLSDLIQVRSYLFIFFNHFDYHFLFPPNFIERSSTASSPSGSQSKVRKSPAKAKNLSTGLSCTADARRVAVNNPVPSGSRQTAARNFPPAPHGNKDSSATGNIRFHS